MVRVRYSFGSRHTGHLKNIRKQRKKFPKITEEVIKISDIILEVLDARFIQETRNKDIEEEIKKQGKKIIYVLNKSDLVNKEEIEKTIKIKQYVFISFTQRLGGNNLRIMIKRTLKDTSIPDNKKRAQVGVIGYPNTGKSSLLNLLTGKPSAGTGSQPGFTKGLQKISLTKEILILDTPGVIPEKNYSTENKKQISQHTKIGARSYSNVKEPEIIIQDLLKDEKIKNSIEKFYSIKTDSDSEKFLEEIGKKKGYLKKGGKVDNDRSARIVLKDWQQGKIK